QPGRARAGRPFRRADLPRRPAGRRRPAAGPAGRAHGPLDRRAEDQVTGAFPSPHAGRGTTKWWRGSATAEPSGPSVSAASPPIHLLITWGGEDPTLPGPSSSA